MRLNRRDFFLVSLILVLAWIFFHFDLKPKSAFYFQKKREEKQLHVKYEFVKDLIDHEQTIKAEFKNLRENANDYARLNHPENVTAELFTTILRQGELNGLVIQSIQPGAWQTISGFSALNIHLVIVGNFLQFAEFIEMLENYALPIEIKELNFRVEKNGFLQIDVHLIGYFFATQQEAVLSKPQIGLRRNTVKKNDRDPFVLDGQHELELSDQSTHEDLLLHSVALRQIKLVGYLQQQDQFWALVMLPNGKTVEISQGSRLGVEDAQVIHLNDREVVVKMDKHQINLAYSL